MHSGYMVRRKCANFVVIELRFMANPTLEGLLRKTGDPALLEKLTAKLSLSELNSLLLEVFRVAAAGVTPVDLVKAYQSNRFVGPS